MRRSSILSSKIARLEKRTGINKPPAIPVEDSLHLIQGTTQEEIQEQQDRIKAEMVQKYGQRVLTKLAFIIVFLGENEISEGPSDAHK
jgi:hypothetical protein